MTIKEIRDMKTEELHSELDRLRRHVFDLRSQAVTEKLQNPYLLTAAKRDIARIFTVLRERNETDIEQKQYHMEALATHRKVRK
jgi:large subunit ribosomal protein L29